MPYVLIRHKVRNFAKWKLDEPTRETGRRGLEAVRATLQRARRDARTADRRHDAA